MEYKNDRLQVTMTNEPGCQVTMAIQLSPIVTREMHKKAIKAVNQACEIPGFRKGKAPEALLLQHRGSQVEREWQEQVRMQSISEACELANLYPFDTRHTHLPKLKNCSMDTGAELEFHFERNPEVPSIDLNALSLEVVTPRTITDADVADELQQVRYHKATWEPVTDRPVQPGDHVDLDIDKIDDPARNLCTDMRFEVKDEKMPKWISKLIIGRNVSESVEGVSENEDATEHFEPTQCRIIVKGIFAPILPELNDELAKSVGAQDLEDLRVKARKRQERESENEAHHIMARKLEDLLLEKYSFELPKRLVEGETQFRLKKRLELLKGRMSEEEIKQTTPALKQLSEQQAKHLWQLFNLLRKAAGEHFGVKQFSFSKEELTQEYMNQTMGTPPEESLIDPSLEGETLRDRLAMILLIKREMNQLMDKLIQK